MSGLERLGGISTAVVVAVVVAGVVAQRTEQDGMRLSQRCGSFCDRLLCLTFSLCFFRKPGSSFRKLQFGSQRVSATHFKCK